MVNISQTMLKLLDGEDLYSIPLLGAEEIECLLMLCGSIMCASNSYMEEDIDRAGFIRHHLLEVYPAPHYL